MTTIPADPRHRNGDERIAVIGLGYVGLPLAVALAAEFDVVGFDIDAERVRRLREGSDDSGEVEPAAIFAVRDRIEFQHDPAALTDCTVYLIAVPTPVNRHKLPDLGPLLAATRAVGAVLKRGDLVVYESTVYPGATDEECAPLLEQLSGLAYNVDFHCGYSPERINPGDRTRRLADIVKVTSGSTPEAAERVDAIYRRIVRAGTHRAPSIRVAEAAKAVENTQRDVNIALANELAVMFHRMGLDTEAVLAAAGTKWNFMPVRPGLVGGHCIGVDPYYLIHKAEEVGAHPELIKAARRINDGMSEYVGTRLLRLMARRGRAVPGARILVLGLTFKENCADLRNTRVVEIVTELRGLQAAVDVLDPRADAAAARREHGIDLCAAPTAGTYDAVLLAVAHDEFRRLAVSEVRSWLRPGGVLFDLRSIWPADRVDERL